MPWFRTRLPPAPGVVRAVDPGHLVVWTEHGLFRFEPGSIPCVQLLHTPAELAGKFDPATGIVRWKQQRYHLVGDPAVVPHTSVVPILSDDDRGDRPVLALHVDRKRRRVEVAEGGTVTLAVPDFPAAGDAWHFAGIVSWRTLVLAAPSGFWRYHYEHAPAPPAPPPPPPVGKWEAAGVAKDNAALLAAIVADPDDDLPRLVYADWLEERGDGDRAEFIRLQCKIADRERAAPVPADDPDAARAEELVAEHGRRWLDELPPVRGVERSDWWRGFPGVVVKSATTLVRSAARLLAAGPVERVTCRNFQRAGFGGYGPLLQSPLVERIRVFELVAQGFEHIPDDPGRVRELLASPRLSGLRGLVLSSCDNAAVLALAGAEHLRGLEWVRVDNLDDEEALALAGSRHLPAVRWVRVGDWRNDCGSLGPAARRALRKRFPVVVFGDE